MIKAQKRPGPKKPAFAAQDSWKRKRLPKSWRRPRGVHSKMRHKLRGNPKMPSQGYRAPRELRGMYPAGFGQVVVSSISQLNEVSEAFIISSAVGLKKRLALISAAKEKKLNILNINADEFVRKAEAWLNERKRKISAAKAARAEKAKKPEKAKEEKEAEKEETEEEKQKAAKKEMEKILAKPQK